jgi:hypothetical protein
LEAYGRNRAGRPRCRRLKTIAVLVRNFEGVTIMPKGSVWQEKAIFLKAISLPLSKGRSQSLRRSRSFNDHFKHSWKDPARQLPPRLRAVR